jgi:hypothetical protein
MAVVTRGTQLYYMTPPTTVTALACPTSITGLDAPREQIETTCLEDTARSYEAGLATPGAASVTVQFDPSEPSHIDLYDMWVNGDPPGKWAIGWSDGTAAPTAALGEWTFPTSRTYTEFEATINSVPMDFQLNAVVTSTVPMQISGLPTLHPKSA